jgi:dynein heavy chain, axonemal
MLEPQEASAVGGTDQTTTLINDILSRIPAVVKKNEDKKTHDAIDICLLQESVRFNKLIIYVDRSLKELLQAIRGEAIMTELLERILVSLNLNQVPKEWEKRAYPSTKPLSSWFEDFLERVKFIRQGVL